MDSWTGLIRKAMITLAVPLSMVASILLALSVSAQWFNPVHAELMPLFGLFFPLFFLLVLFSLVLLAVLQNRFAFVPLFVLLLSLPQAGFYIGRNNSGNGLTNKVLTMNVHGFRGFGKSGSMAEIAGNISDFIRKTGPDHVCIQEFRSWSGDIEKDVLLFAELAGFDHYAYAIYWPKGGSASDIHLIMSRFPITRSGAVNARTGRNLGLYADIAGPDGMFRLVGVHLVSFSLDNNEISMLGQGEMLDGENMRKYAPRLSGKLTNTFRIRALEVEDLMRFVNKSALPVVLAGDFNDTPASYTHRTLRRAGFTDTHPDNGQGLGATYAGRIPMLRIDYVFLSPAFEAGTSRVVRQKLSDHYPLVVTFGKRPAPANSKPE